MDDNQPGFSIFDVFDGCSTRTLHEKVVADSGSRLLFDDS